MTGVSDIALPVPSNHNKLHKIKPLDTTTVVADIKGEEMIETGSGCFFGTVKQPNINDDHSNDNQSSFGGFNNSEIMMGEDRVDVAIDDIENIMHIQPLI